MASEASGSSLWSSSGTVSTLSCWAKNKKWSGLSCLLSSGEEETVTESIVTMILNMWISGVLFSLWVLFNMAHSCHPGVTLLQPLLFCEEIPVFLRWFILLFWSCSSFEQCGIKVFETYLSVFILLSWMGVEEWMVGKFTVF